MASPIHSFIKTVWFGEVMSHENTDLGSFMSPKKKMMMNNPPKFEQRRFIFSCFLFILFLCAVASINELRFRNLLKFSSSCASVPRNSSSTSAGAAADDIRILIGIMTLPDQYQRRHFLRMIYGIQSPAGARIDVKFVFCNLTKEEQHVLVALEIMRYEDIIILNCTENMNQGKTYTYFSSLPEMLNSTEGGPPYHYVMKADDDIFLRLDKLVESLRTLPREDLYYGYVIPCGSMNPFYRYMSGMGYLVSWDIVEWISVSEISRSHLQGPEDRVFGDWMRRGRRGMNRHGVKWGMYNYPDRPTVCTHELWPDTIGVHLLKKQDKWVKTLKYFNFTRDLKPSKLYHIP